MIIRKSTYQDIEVLLAIFSYAREQMALDGNPTQWVEGYPQRAQVEKDIEQGVSYIIIDEVSDEVCGTFVFIVGEDPTYTYIEEGEWVNTSLPYGTIHRIASTGVQHGIFEKVLAWCTHRCANIRIDTHQANQKMIHLIDKAGFHRCGIIYTHNGTKRIAFQRCKKVLNE